MTERRVDDDELANRVEDAVRMFSRPQDRLALDLRDARARVDELEAMHGTINVGFWLDPETNRIHDATPAGLVELTQSQVVEVFEAFLIREAELRSILVEARVAIPFDRHTRDLIGRLYAATDGTNPNKGETG